MKKKIISLVSIIALVAVFTACFVACNTEDNNAEDFSAEGYVARLERKGYTVTLSEYTEEERNEMGVGIVWSLAANNEDTYDYVYIYELTTEEESKSQEEELREITESDSTMTTLIRKGKLLIAGTEQGVEDAINE